MEIRPRPARLSRAGAATATWKFGRDQDRDRGARLRYDDGDEEQFIEPRHIRPSKKPAPSEFKAAPAAPPGTDGAPAVLYAVDFATELAAPRSFEPGEKIFARWPATVSGRFNWFGATVSRRTPDDTYDLVYDDGDLKDDVDVAGILAVAAFEPLYPEPVVLVGDRVLARWKDGPTYFGATVTGVAAASEDRRGATYALKYDDGDVESKVSARRLKVVERHVDDCEDTSTQSTQWHDGTNGCAKYLEQEIKGRDWCNRFGDHPFGAGPPNVHCCACGGGIKTAAAAAAAALKIPLEHSPEPSADWDDPRTKLLAPRTNPAGLGARARALAEGNAPPPDLRAWFDAECGPFGGFVADGVVAVRSPSGNFRRDAKRFPSRRDERNLPSRCQTVPVSPR